MLTEERDLTAIKSSDYITLHSRILNITTQAENGEAWLMFSRPSTFSDAAEMERLSWSTAETNMGRLGLFPEPFASPYLTYDSHLIKVYADKGIRAFESLTKPLRGEIAVFAWPGRPPNPYLATFRAEELGSSWQLFKRYDR
jgi:hypothetical protein